MEVVLDNISLSTCRLIRVFYNISMNGHCSKDMVTSIGYTYNHAEHEVAEREVVERDWFFTKLLFFSSICFFLMYFYLNDLINQC